MNPRSGPEWTLTSATDRVVLDAARGADTSVTVTNLQGAERDVTVVVVTDDTARSWFTVTSPSRRVPAGAAASFAVRVEAPAGAAPGEYAFQLKAYNADEAAEESHNLSGRVVLVIPAPVVPGPRFRAWWLAVPAGLVAVVAAVTALVVVLLPTGRVEPPATVTVPDVTDLDAAQAAEALAQVGLVPAVRYRHSPADAGTVTQSIDPGTEVAPGSAIDVTIVVSLSAPVVPAALNPPDLPLDLPIIGTLSLPPEVPSGSVAGYEHVGLRVDLYWTQPEPYVTRWRVLLLGYWCDLRYADAKPSQLYVDHFHLTEPSLSTTRYTLATDPGAGAGTCGWPYVYWEVAPLDDFGTAGPAFYGLLRVPHSSGGAR